MNRIETFWKWFQDHQKEIFNLKEASIEMQILQLNWLNIHLNHYCNALDIVLVLPNSTAKKAEVRIYSDFFKENLGHAFELINAAPKNPKWDFVLAFSTPKTLRKQIKSLGALTIIPDVEIKGTQSQSTQLLNKSNNPIPAILEMKSQTFFWYTKNHVLEIPDLIFDFGTQSNPIPKFDIVMREQNKHHGPPVLQFYDFDLYIEMVNRIS